MKLLTLLFSAFGLATLSLAPWHAESTRGAATGLNTGASAQTHSEAATSTRASAMEFYIPSGRLSTQPLLELPMSPLAVVGIDTPYDQTYFYLHIHDSMMNYLSSQSQGYYSSGSNSANAPSTSVATEGNVDQTIVQTWSGLSGSNGCGTFGLNCSGTAGDGWATINFGQSYSSAPFVVVTPCNAYAEQVNSNGSYASIPGYYVTSNTSSFTIYVHELAGSVINPQYNYIVAQHP